jgi:hypothetical protein
MVSTRLPLNKLDKRPSWKAEQLLRTISMGHTNNNSEPKGDCVFYVCDGFKKSVGCGSRILTYDLSRIIRASRRAIVFFMSVMALKNRLVAGQDLNLRPFANNKSEPEGDCVFYVCDVFKESVGCGSRILIYDLSRIIRASRRAIVFFMSVMSLKNRLVAGAGF